MGSMLHSQSAQAPVRARFVLGLLLLLAMQCVSCAASVVVLGTLIPGKGGGANSWPDNLGVDDRTDRFLTQHTDKLRQAIEDQCAPLPPENESVSPPETQVHLISWHSSGGSSPWNWLLLPYNVIPFASLGIFPILAVVSSEQSAMAWLQVGTSRHATVEAKVSDHALTLLWYPLRFGPDFPTWGGESVILPHSANEDGRLAKAIVSQLRESRDAGTEGDAPASRVTEVTILCNGNTLLPSPEDPGAVGSRGFREQGAVVGSHALGSSNCCFHLTAASGGE